MGREQCTETLVLYKDLIWVCCVRPGLTHLRRVSWLYKIRNPPHRECMVPTALVAALDKALRDVAGRRQAPPVGAESRRRAFGTVPACPAALL